LKCENVQTLANSYVNLMFEIGVIEAHQCDAYANKSLAVLSLLMIKGFIECADLQEDEKLETHLHVAVNCVSQSLQTQIIGRSNDEVAICFFNTVRFRVQSYECISCLLGFLTRQNLLKYQMFISGG